MHDDDDVVVDDDDDDVADDGEIERSISEDDPLPEVGDDEFDEKMEDRDQLLDKAGEDGFMGNEHDKFIMGIDDDGFMVDDEEPLANEEPKEIGLTDPSDDGSDTTEV